MKYFALAFMFPAALQAWPLPLPDMQPPTAPLAKSAEWTGSGGSGHITILRQICQETFVRCESVQPAAVTGAIDHGFRMFRKDNGAYLGTINRNTAEEIEADYRKAIDVAEEHKPQSNWVAREEAKIARLEYVAAACAAGGVYCTGMAARMQKFKELFSAACSAWTGACVVKIKEEQAAIKKRIDYVEAQCAAGDQQCFDAVTNGGESLAKAERQIEKSAGGARPPHAPPRPGSGRPPFLPGGDTSGWYDGSCENCKVLEGKDAEEY